MSTLLNRKPTTPRPTSAAGVGGSGVVGPPRGRRTNVPLLVGALLLIVGCAVAGGWVFSVSGGRYAVLVAARDIAPGRVIVEADLAEAQLSGSGVAVVGAKDRASLVGKVATAGVPAGSVLNAKMVATSPLPGPGQVAVGVALKPGQVPGELGPGRLVDVLAVPAAGAASTAGSGGEAVVLAKSGTVLSMTSSPSGGWTATVVVPAANAAQVAAASSAGRAALVMLPLGGS